MRLRFAVLGSVLATRGRRGVAGRRQRRTQAQPRPDDQRHAQPDRRRGRRADLRPAERPARRRSDDRLYHHISGSHPFFTLIGTTTTDALGFYKFTRAEGIVMTNRSWFVRGPGFTPQPHGPRARRGASQHQREQPQRVTRSTRSCSPVTSRRTTPASACSCRSRRATATTGARSTAACFDRARTTRSRTAGGSLATATSACVLRTDLRNIRGESDPVTVTIQQAQVADFTINSSIRSSRRARQRRSPACSTSRARRPPSRAPRDAVGPHRRPGALPAAAGRDHDGTDGSYSFTCPADATTPSTRCARRFAPPRHTAVLFEGVQDVVSSLADPTTSTGRWQVTFTGTGHAGQGRSRDLPAAARLRRRLAHRRGHGRAAELDVPVRVDVREGGHRAVPRADLRRSEQHRRCTRRR